MTKTVAVIGAGIAGISTAYYLAKVGYKVTVIEKEQYPAMKTSFSNGGQISVSNSEVWTTWGNVKKGMSWIFKKDAPLLIRPRLDPAQWLWMFKFLYHTAKGDYQTNTVKTIQMGLEARKMYEEIIKNEDINFDYNKCGILHIYKDSSYFAAAKEVQELYENSGCEWDIVSTKEIADIDPTLENLGDIVGGVWTQGDSVGDIHKFCHSLESILKNKYHVDFIYNENVTDLNNLDYDTVVVANGIGSVALAKSIGDRLPIYPVKGYSITINNVETRYLPKVSLLDDQAKIVTASLGNRLRVAGTAELSGENYDIRRDRIEPLLNWVSVNFPDINTHDYSQWACLRPMTPNMMPIVTQSKKNTKIFYHVGHGHLGWTLSPATAKQVVELIESAT